MDIEYNMEELMKYNHEEDEDFMYPCRGCGDLHDINCDPIEFDPDMQYCGKNSGCCP